MSLKTLKEIDSILRKVTDIHDPIFEDFALDNRKGVTKLIEKYKKSLQKLEKLKISHQKRQEFEFTYRQQGYQTIVGIDEVGRGPLAGPLVIGAVILPEDCSPLLGVNDSKQLSVKKRQKYVETIKQYALEYVIKEVSVEEIDRLNIYQATKQAMQAILDDFSMSIDLALVDAMPLDPNIAHVSIVKGDQRSLSIAAASILAKDYRDKIMVSMAQIYPQYGFDSNVGYGTPQHLKALEIYGPSPIHRKSFEPVKSLIN